MADELKPCPFCGEADVMRLKMDGEPTGMVAHCCYVLGREIRAQEDGWNTRHERTCEASCPECGASLNANWGYCDACGEWREA